MLGVEYKKLRALRIYGQEGYDGRRLASSDQKHVYTLLLYETAPPPTHNPGMLTHSGEVQSSTTRSYHSYTEF